MSPEKIYELFCKEFPNVVSQVTKWFGRKKDSKYANGSIRLILKNGKTLIFGINEDGSWSLAN